MPLLVILGVIVISYATLTKKKTVVENLDITQNEKNHLRNATKALGKIIGRIDTYPKETTQVPQINENRASISQPTITLQPNIGQKDAAVIIK